MATAAYAHHAQAALDVDAAGVSVFAALDDHRRLSAHMESPSMAMAGASMHVELDDRQGRGIGARIAMTGRVFGIALALDEAVVEYEPPRRKVWETLGEPRLIVIGAYRMGFEVVPKGAGSRVRMWIDYADPNRGIGRWLAPLFGAMYARWCLRQMIGAARGA
jgi:hypothetical protein